VTLTVFLAVLAAALMHAAWSAGIKGSGDPRAASLAMSMGTAVIAIGVVAFAGPLTPAAWPWLAASLLAHAAYMRLTAQAYVSGDLSLVYPISRGLGPLAATGLALLFAGEAPGAGTLAGVGLVSLGALTIGWSAIRAKADSAGAVGLALIVAIAIAGYTFLDGVGARTAQTAIAYTGWLMLLQGVVNLAVFALFGGAAVVRPAFTMLPRFGLMGGALSGVSYGIALWAMTQAPIGAVAALRETSIAFATLIGAVILKEKVSAPRAAGVALILAGAAAIQLTTR
jgi:drug/metabolite transporter (DMT)-like permease